MVPAGDIDLFVDDSGSGDPVVLHPGLGYAAWCWQPLKAELDDAYRTLAVDTRGAGRSNKPEGPYSIDMFADDVAAALDMLDIPAVHFVGHSMGGFVAQRFASRHPERATSIAIIAAHPGQPGALGVPDSTLALWEEASTLDAAGYARATFATSFREGWTDEHSDRFDELLTARLKFPTPPERWRDHFNAGSDFADTEWDTAEITCPVLVVHGTADRVVPYANAELLMERFPGARLAHRDGGGHNLPLEEPAWLAAEMRAFFG